MVQNAVVKKRMGQGVVEVSLLRQMECGLHCDGACAGCTQKPKEELLALASDPIGTRPGDLVEVEPAGGHGLALPAMVFGLPCVGLAAGYVLGLALGLGEGLSLLTAAAGLLAGFLPAVLVNRHIVRSAAPEFQILKFLR